MSIRMSDDLLTKENVNNPHPYFHELRSKAPIYWNEKYRGWIFTRYKDVDTLLSSPDLTAERMKPPKNMPEELVLDMSTTFQVLSRWLVFQDPPNHTRLRLLLNKAFTPKAVEKMRPFVYELTDYFLDKMDGSKKVELIKEYTFLIPVFVISHMLGIPKEDRDLIKQWSDDLLLFVFGAVNNPERHERAKNGLQQMVEYLEDVIKSRMKNPKEDLITALVQTKEKEDSLSLEEIISTCTLLVFGGHDTTTNLIANGLYSLMKNPDQFEMLKNDPSLINTAVEELLRYDGPSKSTLRIAKNDFEYEGVQIKKEDRVLLINAAANRDPEVFEDPDKLDITRHPNRHMGFGKGIHYCLGAPLARLEATIAINQIIKRFPNMELERENLDWKPIITARALKELPVILN